MYRCDLADTFMVTIDCHEMCFWTQFCFVKRILKKWIQTIFLDSFNGLSSDLYIYFNLQWSAFESVDKYIPWKLISFCCVKSIIAEVRKSVIYLFQGWYIVTYALGIYLLNLFIAFLTPQIDPALLEDPGTWIFSSTFLLVVI